MIFAGFLKRLGNGEKSGNDCSQVPRLSGFPPSSKAANRVVLSIPVGGYPRCKFSHLLSLHQYQVNHLVLGCPVVIKNEGFRNTRIWRNIFHKRILYMKDQNKGFRDARITRNFLHKRILYHFSRYSFLSSITGVTFWTLEKKKLVKNHYSHGEAFDQTTTSTLRNKAAISEGKIYLCVTPSWPIPFFFPRRA